MGCLQSIYDKNKIKNEVSIMKTNKITKILTLFSLGFILASCEVKETDNYNLVQDPLYAGRIGSEAGIWTQESGSYLSLQGAPSENIGLRLPAYETGNNGTHNISFITNKGDAVFTLQQSNLDVGVYKEPYFAIAIGKVTSGKFLNGTMTPSKFTGKVYDMTKKPAGDTQIVEGKTLKFKQVYNLDMDLTFAKKENTFEKKIAAALNFENGTLGSYKGEFKRIEPTLNTGIFTDGTKYKCWAKTKAKELSGREVLSGMVFTTTIKEKTPSTTPKTFYTAFDRNTTGSGLGRDCVMNIKLDSSYNSQDPGFLNATGVVKDCTGDVFGSMSEADKKLLHSNDYKGLALSYNDKRFGIWMVSEKNKNPLVLECIRQGN